MRVGIIGSGLGGLSAAINLAKNGYDVKVFEKNESPGGKASEIRLGDYRFDIGPTLITMPFVIKELLKDSPEKLEIQELDNICRYFWEDSTVIDAFSNSQKFASELEKIDSDDAKNYSAFLEYCEEMYELTKKTFLFEPFGEASYLLNMETLKKVPKLRKLDSFRTVDSGVRKFFKNEKIIQLFGRYATYNGSSPYKAPATLNIIPWVEFGLGGNYIKGGIYQLSKVLYNYSKNLGVDFRFNSKVEKINVENKVAKGIEYSSNGSELIYEEFDFVLANSDVAETYNYLIDGFEEKKKKLNRLEPSSSGFIILWGINQKNEPLEHHNVLFSNNYKEEFEYLFDKKEIYSDPTIYISISSRKDKDHAPSNSENWFVLINSPSLNNIYWEEEKPRVRKVIIEKLKKNGLDIENHIEEEMIISPDDLYRRYLSNKGSIYGFSSNDRNSAFLRPRNRNREIKNLFFAGGSSHPGGGVPLVILSGKHAAELIIRQSKEQK